MCRLHKMPRTTPITSPAAKGLVILGLIVAAWGCAGTDTRSSSLVDNPSVPVPPELDEAKVKPHDAETLKKARMSLDQIIATLPRPDYLALPATQTPGSSPEPPVDPEDPPAAAQRAYVAALQAIHDRHLAEAIGHLRIADRLAPNRPEILRNLGDAHWFNGNRIRGAEYLARAVTLEPDDLEAVYRLGQHAAELGQWQQAIVTFHHALDLLEKPHVGPEYTRAGRQLMLQYFLADSLRQNGFDLAAVNLSKAYLESISAFSNLRRLPPEIRVLQRQQGNTWMAIGDALSRTGEPSGALDAYQRAREIGTSAARDLMLRRLYANLRLGRKDAALQTVLDQIEQTEPSTNTLALVSYLLENEIDDTDALVVRLRHAYMQRGRPTEMLMTIVGLLEPAKAHALLREHLDHRAGDRKAFEKMLAMQLAGEDGAFRPEQIADAIETTSLVAARNDRLIYTYVATLLKAVGQGERVLEGFEHGDHQREPIVRAIKGLCLVRLNHLDRAMTLFKQLVDEAPDLRPARTQLIILLNHKGEHEAALKLIEPLQDQSWPSLVVLHARTLAGLNRFDEAAALLDDAAAGSNPDLSVVLAWADLEQRRGNVLKAERILSSALNSKPREKRLYEAIFNLYLDPTNRSHQAAFREQYKSRLRQMIRALPLNRSARIRQAWQLATQGQGSRAVELLESLLREDYRDQRPMILLVDIFDASDQVDRSNELIRQQLAKFPDNGILLRLASKHFSQTDQMTESFALVERAFEAETLISRPRHWFLLPAAAGFRGIQYEPPLKQVDLATGFLPAPLDDLSLPIDLAYGYLLAQARRDKLEFADGQIVDLARRYPEHDADLNYYRAMIFIGLNQQQRGEQIMIDLLKRHPHHAGANNDLGYTWADRGEHLEEARQMIQMAVDAEPKSASYIDSLGWVNYKLGRFDEAIMALRRAHELRRLDPIILDHLGDALFRAGNKPKAGQRWKQAEEQIKKRGPNIRANHRELAARVGLKLKALRANARPPVADIPAIDAKGAPQPPEA